VNTKLKTILFVDDEPHIREVLCMAIEIQTTWTVETCASGEEALTALSQKLPDLLILDYMMPGMDGPSVLQAVRARPDCEHLPIVFLTAKTLPAEVRRLKAMGATGVLGKPFDPMTICGELERIWDGQSFLRS
jgi:two-component system, OmpR family, response regulator